MEILEDTRDSDALLSSCLFSLFDSSPTSSAATLKCTFASSVAAVALPTKAPTVSTPLKPGTGKIVATLKTCDNASTLRQTPKN